MLKLEKDSSDDFLRGLRWRLGGPKGDGGLGMKRFVVSGTGEEWALAICGARRELPEDRERAWPLVKGERVRGRRGREAVGVFTIGRAGDWVSWTMARPGVSGRSSVGSSEGGGLGRGFIVNGRTEGGSTGSETRGAMVMICVESEGRKRVIALS